MPRSGDGDLWPTDDGDSSSQGAGGEATRQVQVPPGRPHQREQWWPTDQGTDRPRQEQPGQGHSWFDRHAPAEQAAAGTPRDQTHAEPRRPEQRTQPVSWPVTGLERQAREEATRRIQLPQPQDPARPAPTPPQQDQQTRQVPVPPRRQEEWPPQEPPRAAPARVGQQPEEDGEPQVLPKRRRPLLIALVALVAVVGIAAGVVFGVPGLSDRLGITGGAPAFVAPPPPKAVEFTPGLRGPDPQAPAPTPQGMQNALAGPSADPALGTLTGAVLDPVTGATLWESGAGEPLPPASTVKLLTAAAALLSLDHTTRLVTKVVAGEQPGSVVIVGGGDPTLSSLPPGEQSVYPGAPHLSDLVDQVMASGVPVQTVHVDLDRYAGDGMAPGWLQADISNSIGEGYITPMVPAMLDGGRNDPTVDYSPRTANPSGVLVEEFATRVGATAAQDAQAKAPQNARVLGEVRSAPLVTLVDNLLGHSDNILAEAVAREVAIEAGQEPSFAGGSKATLDVLRQNGFVVDGVVLADASGMSTDDRVPAKLLADVLKVAAGPAGKDPRTAKLRPLLGGLPIAGGSGTLAGRYTEDGATEGRGWVRAKTGTLSGVNSLAGIVLDADNRPLVFAFMSSGAATGPAREALDRLSAALRGCGCR